MYESCACCHQTLIKGQYYLCNNCESELEHFNTLRERGICVNCETNKAMKDCDACEECMSEPIFDDIPY